MTGLPWYKRDPDAFITGCENGRLTLEEVGAYALLIDEMYRRGGPLIDHPKYGCTYLRCDTRVWLRVRAALIRKGKIYATAGGYLSNTRVEQELKAQYDLREIRARAARLARQKDADTTLPTPQLSRNSSVTEGQLSPSETPSVLNAQGNASANADHLLSRYRVREESLPSGVVGSPPTSIDEPIEKALEAFNAAAKRAGWISARLPIGAQRRRTVRARLKALGPDGWLGLIAAAEAQPFLAGVNDRGWRVDLSFLASERGATAILEGKYLKPGGAPALTPLEQRAERERAFLEHGHWNPAWGDAPIKAGERT